MENWKRLYNTEVNKKKGHAKQHPELVEVLNEFDHVNLTEADPTMASLFILKLDWNDALSMIYMMKRNGAKYFREGGDIHLLLYNARYMDYLIHLKVTKENAIEGWMVSREERTDTTHFGGAEIEQMTNLSKMLFYYLWRNIAGRKSINYI